jgi:hypothetical protein
MSDIQYEIVQDTPATKRGRKPKTEISPESQIMDLVQSENEQENETIQEVLAEFGDSQPFDMYEYGMKAKACLDFSGMTALAGGKYLRVMKEHTHHGEWLPTLKKFGINPNTAAKAMRTAEKFGKFVNFTNFSYSKVDLLEEFTNEEVEALNAGEEVNGTTLEDWENLPVPMLRKKVQDYKKQIEAGKAREKALSDVIEEKSRQYREMEKRFLDETPEENARQKLRDIDRGDSGYFKAIYLVSQYLNECITMIHQAEAIPGINGDILEEWTLKYENVGDSIARLFEVWRDVVTNICPDQPKEEPVL